MQNEPTQDAGTETQAPIQQRLTLTLDEARLELNLSRNSTLALIRTGKLRAAQFGRKWIIPRKALEACVAQLEGQVKLEEMRR